jgi:AcrR family transcriptional regulator
MASSPAKQRPVGARPRSSGPAQPLSRERIVQAALELVEDESLAGLTTRKLGARLGCEAMSIYHHYPSKAHLLDALVDHVIEEMVPDPPHPEPIEQLRAILRAYRQMARRHPALYPLVAVHRLNTPTGVRAIERVVEAVRAVVPDVELAARHFRTIGYYITGAALDETSGYARGPSAAEPVDDRYVAEHCPRLAESAPYFQARHWEGTFELGLEALLAKVVADGDALRRARGEQRLPGGAGAAARRRARPA